MPNTIEVTQADREAAASCVDFTDPQETQAFVERAGPIIARHRIASTRTVDTELLEAARLCINVAESWIHDQLDGTSALDDALAELAPARAAITKAEAGS